MDNSPHGTNSRKPYSERLKDPRWQKLSAKIKDAAGWACEDCGRRDKTLEVHHTAYIRGKEPWEHPYELLMCLCCDCHARRQQLEDGFRVALGRITRHLKPEQLEKEVWDILKGVSVRETQRLAEAFS